VFERGVGGENPLHLRRQCEKARMREGAMSDIRNWASVAVVAGLILLPHNRIHCACHDRDAGRLDGAGRVRPPFGPPSLALWHGFCCANSGAAPYISIKVARSLADWLPGRGEGWAASAKCAGQSGRFGGCLSSPIGGLTPLLTEVRPHQSSGELDYQVHITDLNRRFPLSLLSSD